MKFFLVIVGVLALLAIVQAKALNNEEENPQLPNEGPQYKPHHGPYPGPQSGPDSDPNPEQMQPNEENSEIPKAEHVLLISGSYIGDDNTLIEKNGTPENSTEDNSETAEDKHGFSISGSQIGNNNKIIEIKGTPESSSKRLCYYND